MGEIERVLIVAAAGRLGAALRALLGATAEFQVLAATCGEVLSETGGPSPAVVVLAGNPRGVNLPQVMGHIRKRWPGAKLLVLAEDASQWREAKAVGADRVHFKGITPEKLVRAVGRLLEGQREEGGQGVGSLLGVEIGGDPDESGLAGG